METYKEYEIVETTTTDELRNELALFAAKGFRLAGYQIASGNKGGYKIHVHYAILERDRPGVPMTPSFKKKVAATDRALYGRTYVKD